MFVIIYILVQGWEWGHTPIDAIYFVPEGFIVRKLFPMS
jgi:hypothetical protein